MRPGLEKEIPSNGNNTMRITSIKARCRSSVVAIAAVGALLAGGQTRAAILAVDFNDNDDGPQLTQTGFAAVTTSGATVASDLGVGGTVTVSLPVLSGADDRDRGALTGGPGLPQSDLLRDFVFRGGTGLVVQVDVLKAGEYTFTGFFHDNAAQQKTGRLTVDLDGYDTGTLGEVEVVSSFDFSTGTAPAAVGTASFTFEADGTNPVAIVVRSADNGTAHVINGFTLAPIPEPSSSVLLVGVLGVGLLGRRRALQ